MKVQAQVVNVQRSTPRPQTDKIQVLPYEKDRQGFEFVAHLECWFSLDPNRRESTPHSAGIGLTALALFPSSPCLLDTRFLQGPISTTGARHAAPKSGNFHCLVFCFLRPCWQPIQLYFLFPSYGGSLRISSATRWIGRASHHDSFYIRYFSQKSTGEWRNQSNWRGHTRCL